MLRKSITRILIAATLVVALTLSFAPPALAFDSRAGNDIIIPASEIVDDDLYVSAETLVIDGTVKGDVIAIAKTITINGTVEGDLIVAGQVIIINGSVQDDVRMAGAAFLIGEKASIGSDIIAAGASFEARPGSSIGKDVIYAGGQMLMAGDVGRDMHVATGGFELLGKVGGNVSTDVGGADAQDGGGPRSYMGNDMGISIPDVKPGLTFGPKAKISGTLDYTTTKEIKIAEGVVAGKVTHLLPKVDEKDAVKMPTLPEIMMNGVFDVIRNIISFILIGLLLIWLFPAFLQTTTERIKAAPLPSLGWGVVHVAAFFFALLVLTVAMVLGAIAFGILTLESLSGTIVFIGLLLIFATIVSFSLAVGFVAEILVSILGGQLILSRINPELAANKYWPLVIGAVIYGVIAGIPVLGWLFSLIAVLIGLGAIWFFGQGLITKKPVIG